MLWCEETSGDVYPQEIVIVSDLSRIFIPNDVGLLVAQLFLRKMVVSL